jgi:catechol-2,3-dioxygenase
MSALTETRPLRDNELDVRALAFVTVPVADLVAAQAFYNGILGAQSAGSDQLPGFPAHHVMRLPSRQFLVLTGPQGPDTRDTGVHHAYRVSAAARAAIAERLAAHNVTVHTYNEDRVKEDGENFYFHDVDGNRIQLVVSAKAAAKDGIAAIDHTAVLSYDMLWAESYYGQDLKFAVESRVGVRTADQARARRWAAGEEDMAPGTRRIDKLYMPMGGQNEVVRANMQVYFTAGDSIFGLYLATKHQQEPPEEQIIGTPRTGFFVARGELDRIAASLAKRQRLFEGPVDHPAAASFAASLYCKDLSGNFLEFCAPRG